MTGKKLVGAGLLLFATGCSEASTVEPAGAPSAMASRDPIVFEGEKNHAHSVINVVYDMSVGEGGPLLFGSRPVGPVRWPVQGNGRVGPLYVVVYPVGSSVTNLMCYDIPMENCPDHGPQIAFGAMAANPAVYGDGVLGHDHMSDKNTYAAAYPVFVLFTNKPAANTKITTKAGIDAAIASGNAFMAPAPAFSFINAPVDARIYEMALPWICPAYTTC